MTEEEIKAMADERDALRAERDALARTRDDLLGETKAEKEKRRALEEERAALTAAAEKREREAAEASGNVEAIKAQMKAAHDREVAQERQARETAEGRVNRLVIDAGLREAMSAAGVGSQFMKGASLAFRDGRKIEIKDDAALVDGVPLAQAVTEWAASEDGSPYKAASQSRGGGAPGGGKGGGGSFADMTEAERLKLAKADPGALKAMSGRK